MRTLLFGAVGLALLLSGLVAGVGGVGLQLADPCPTTYRLSLQPADAAADPPDETVRFASLSEYQRTAVTAALENRTRRTFGSRSRLEPLTDVVVAVGDDRYVADLVRSPCRSPYDELTIGGFAGATVGFFLAVYAAVLRRFR